MVLGRGGFREGIWGGGFREEIWVVVLGKGFGRMNVLSISSVYFIGLYALLQLNFLKL